MKKWKFSVTIFDNIGGFNAELSYDDLKSALKCFCKFVTMDCDIVKLLDNKGVILEYVR